MQLELFGADDYRQTSQERAGDLEDLQVPTIVSIQRNIDIEWDLSKPWFVLLHAGVGC